MSLGHVFVGKSFSKDPSSKDSFFKTHFFEKLFLNIFFRKTLSGNFLLEASFPGNHFRKLFPAHLFLHAAYLLRLTGLLPLPIIKLKQNTHSL